MRPDETRPTPAQLERLAWIAHTALGRVTLLPEDRAALAAVLGRLETLEAASAELLEFGGQCIYGCLELAEVDDIREAYQLGSAHAFEKCVRIFCATPDPTEGDLDA